MITPIHINNFVNLPPQSIIIDVRSPIEYLQAHIVDAVNVPLFTNDERAAVGTTYKQQGKQAAIKIGLDYYGVKMRKIVEEVEQIIEAKKTELHNNNGTSTTESTDTVTLYLHCARGGMRSAAMAWLLSLYGYKIAVLVGGYKAYRNWVLAQFEKDYTLTILGGYTGTGKTHLLQQPYKAFTVIDLEALANHRGSAFGHIGMPVQPTQEMFENKLAKAFYHTNNTTTTNILLEDESRRIGTCMLPNNIYNQMRRAKVYFVEKNFAERLKNIMVDYGTLPPIALQESIIKISKRLGGLETKNALLHLENNDLQSCFGILLHYYDKYYHKGLLGRDTPPSDIIKLSEAEFISIGDATTITPTN